MKCPTCGLETSGPRCPRCNTPLIGPCSGRCAGCVVTCDDPNAPQDVCTSAVPGGVLEKVRRLWRQTLPHST